MPFSVKDKESVLAGKYVNLMMSVMNDVMNECYEVVRGHCSRGNPYGLSRPIIQTIPITMNATSYFNTNQFYPFHDFTPTIL